MRCCLASTCILKSNLFVKSECDSIVSVRWDGDSLLGCVFFLDVWTSFMNNRGLVSNPTVLRSAKTPLFYMEFTAK